MRREFLKHGLVYGAANLIASAGTVLLVPVYTHSLRPGDYGVVDYVLVVQNLVLVCAGLEMTQGIARFYAQAKTEEDRRAYASTGLWFLLGSFATVCAALYALGLFLGAGVLGMGEDRALFALALLSIYSRVLFYALQGQLRWELRSDLYSIASFIATATSVGAVSFLLLVRGAGIAGVFAGLAFGYGAGCAFCLVSLRTTYRWMFDTGKLRQMMRFSLPLVFSSLALFVASYGDRILLRSSLGFHELGIYGIGARVAAVITLAINGFQLGAAPLIYREHAEPGTPDTLAQLMRLFLVTGLMGVVGLAAFSVEILSVVATPDYATASRLIPILACAIVVSNLYVFVPGLTIHHLTLRFAAINIVSAGITFSLVATLLSFFGMLGAAVGVLGGATVGFAMHAASSQRVYRLPLAWRRIGGAGLVAGLGIATNLAIGDAGLAGLGARVSVFAVAAMLLVVILLTASERASAKHVVLSRLGALWSGA